MTVTSNKSTDFSATDSALGYLYQVRLALLSSLQRLKKDENFSVYIETLDDVVFETDGSPIELLQLKHHNRNAANLTDASSDFWKSLRIWIEGKENGEIAKDARLYLITTSNIGETSLLQYLLDENRNEEKVLQGLLRTASTSENKINQKAYKLFQCLDLNKQCDLLRSITIFPNAPNIEDIKDELLKEAKFSVNRNHLNLFLERLEGWWFRETLDQMRNPNILPINSRKIETKMDELREQFKRDALPLDQEIFDVEIKDHIYNEYLFVKQLNISEIKSRKVLRAVQDFYRAYTQRSRWMRDDLLYSNELIRYENSLTEKWGIEFEDLTDKISVNATHQEKLETAKNVYHWVERQCCPIRQISDESLTRGSFHILSDRLKVGWHPDFEELLKPFLDIRGLQ